MNDSGREREIRICPKCGRQYTEEPALSRVDGQTPICPDCGIREALEAMELPEGERERIITEIHLAMG